MSLLDWLWPVAGTRITQQPNAGHVAYDVGVPVGTQVRAPVSGTVIETRPDRGPQSYGNLVIMRADDGNYVYLAHLSAFGVRPGQRVTRGQPIALTGNTGRSTGPHLHIEVRDPAGRAVSPQRFFGSAPILSDPNPPLTPRATPPPSAPRQPVTKTGLIGYRPIVTMTNVSRPAASPDSAVRAGATVAGAAVAGALPGVAAGAPAAAQVAGQSAAAVVESVKSAIPWTSLAVGGVGVALMLIGASGLGRQGGDTAKKFAPSLPVQIANRLGDQEVVTDAIGIASPVAGLAAKVLTGKSRGARRASARRLASSARAKPKAKSSSEGKS